MYSCRTLADSIGPHGHRLVTFEITYPRYVHEELMTHRMLSRNTSSSRAVPVAKVIEQVKNNPVIPLSFGRNERGMVSTKSLDVVQSIQATEAWLEGRDYAVHVAEKLAQLEVHKQFVNRLLMPYCWITTIVSATEWENFFGLRLAPDVQPEMRKIASLMAAEYYEVSVPKELEFGDWHTPLLTKQEYDTWDVDTCGAVSSARCAAVSYLRQHDDRTKEEWLSVFSKLVSNGHWSPLEHVAECSSADRLGGNFRGWYQFRHYITRYTNPSDTRTFTQADYRKLIAQE